MAELSIAHGCRACIAPHLQHARSATCAVGRPAPTPHVGAALSARFAVDTPSGAARPSQRASRRVSTRVYTPALLATVAGNPETLGEAPTLGDPHRSLPGVWSIQFTFGTDHRFASVLRPSPCMKGGVPPFKTEVAAFHSHAEAKPTIGFLGMGIMGVPMTQNLLAAGYQVRGASRTECPWHQGVKPSLQTQA